MRGRGLTDAYTGQTSVDSNAARYTNVAIGTGSRGVRNEIFLQHWVQFDPGAKAATNNDIKFVWVNRLVRGTLAVRQKEMKFEVLNRDG